MASALKPGKINGICRYEVESDLRALRNANSIQKDAKRLSAVKTLIKEEMGALEQLAGNKKEGFSSEY